MYDKGVLLTETEIKYTNVRYSLHAIMILLNWTLPFQPQTSAV